MSSMLQLLAGTTKGLLVLQRFGDEWSPVAVHFQGLPVSMIWVDERHGTWWVALSHKHWGEKLHRSADKGIHWDEVPVPSFKGYELAGKAPRLKRIWSMQHGGVDRPEELWLAAEPAALFHSKDHGNSFQMADSLWNFPGRHDPAQWFGAGKDDPFVHTILTDPRDSQHLYVAVSCAGVFESSDRGNSWQARNEGLVAAYLPHHFPKVGHDPHGILQCSKYPDVIWQQNHCGIFRSTNGGRQWTDVSGKNDYPKYGFALAIDDEDPDQAWVIPAISDEQRIPPNLQLAVCHTQDGGKTWSKCDRGLPDQFAFDLVLRQAFVKNGDWLLFGTNNGNIYASFDRGASWKLSTGHAAPVNTLAFAEIN